jgi:hypothetical protein
MQREHLNVFSVILVRIRIKNSDFLGEKQNRNLFLDKTRKDLRYHLYNKTF